MFNFTPLTHFFLRKKISSETKARVAIEAVRGMKTISEIAAQYDVHPNQVSIWKKQFLESASETFSHILLPIRRNSRPRIWMRFIARLASWKLRTTF